MDNLYIEGSRITPSVRFDTHTGIFELKGRSSPDNSILFYEQIFKYFYEYFQWGIKVDLKINIGLEYFNTSSLKCIFQIIKKIKEETDNTSLSFEVNWFYERDDEDMLETGEDISSLLGIEFNFISENVSTSKPF